MDLKSVSDEQYLQLIGIIPALQYTLQRIAAIQSPLLIKKNAPHSPMAESSASSLPPPSTFGESELNIYELAADVLSSSAALFPTAKPASSLSPMHAVHRRVRKSTKGKESGEREAVVDDSIINKPIDRERKIAERLYERKPKGSMIDEKSIVAAKREKKLHHVASLPVLTKNRLSTQQPNTHHNKEKSLENIKKKRISSSNQSTNNHYQHTDNNNDDHTSTPPPSILPTNDRSNHGSFTEKKQSSKAKGAAERGKILPRNNHNLSNHPHNNNNNSNHIYDDNNNNNNNNSNSNNNDGIQKGGTSSSNTPSAPSSNDVIHTRHPSSSDPPPSDNRQMPPSKIPRPIGPLSSLHLDAGRRSKPSSNPSSPSRLIQPKSYPAIR